MNIKESLSKLTDHKNIYLTSRGNKAIEHALSLVKGNLLIPDQGSWMSYRKIAKKWGLEVVELKTDYGVIDLDDLKQKVGDASALIYQNPAGYFADQPIKEIYEICRDKCLVILDVSGCIGDDELCSGNYADIIVSSFGKWKLIDVGYGGFISSNRELNIEEDFDESYFDRLNEKINGLDKRLKILYDKCSKIKKDLSDFNIIHKDKKGIVVVVKFESENKIRKGQNSFLSQKSSVSRKSEIIKYCEKQNYEYALCPREIRVNCNAVSIEVKRIQKKHQKSLNS